MTTIHQLDQGRMSVGRVLRLVKSRNARRGSGGMKLPVLARDDRMSLARGE